MPEQLPGKADAKVKPENPFCDLLKGIFFLINFEGLLFKDLPYHLDFYRDDKGSS